MEDDSADSPRCGPAAHAGLAEGGLQLLESSTYKIVWSRHDETGVDATETAVASSKYELICLKERMW